MFDEELLWSFIVVDFIPKLVPQNLKPVKAVLGRGGGGVTYLILTGGSDPVSCVLVAHCFSSVEVTVVQKKYIVFYPRVHVMQTGVFLVVFPHVFSFG